MDSKSPDPLDPQHYRALVEHTLTMLWRAGVDAQCNYVNAAWLAFTGRRFAEEMGLGWLEGVHPADREGFHATYVDGFRRRSAFEMQFRLRRFDGVYRTFLNCGTPFIDSGGAFQGFMGSCVDRGDSRADDMLLGAHEFFEMSLDNLCVAGFDGYFKLLNPSWTKTLGWTVDELLAKPSIEFVHPDDHGALLSGRQRLMGGAPLGPLRNRYLCKDGSYRWFEWRSFANPDRQLVYAAARDITEQKQAEERLLAAQVLQDKMQRQLIFSDRMASVGTLAAGVAHEVNNPLSSVTANINLLIEDLQGMVAASASAKLNEMIEMATDVQVGAERIRKIVRGLKTFSRSENEQRDVIDVRPLLELSVDMAFNEIRHRARLVKDYGPVPLVEADEAQLGQVFINLLVNAVQSMPEGNIGGNEIRVVTATDEAGRAVIEFRDTGRGIPAHQVGRIFDPFFTTKPVGVGTGLGLSICHNIVVALGGEISAVSKEGQGTTFTVVLPAAVAAPDQVIMPGGKVGGDIKRRGAVLVVDDDSSVGIVLGRVLRSHEVTITTSAREALDLLAGGKQFHVILSDLMMPEMSGMEFYAEVARRFPDSAARVVFITGGAFAPAASTFLDRVANERIDKPLHPQTVRELVQRFVG